MKKRLLVASVALMAAGSIFLTGCMTFPAGIAPSNVPITSNDTVTVIGPASGSAWAVAPLGIIVGEFHPEGSAEKRALSSSGGDALIDVKTEEHMYNIMGLFALYQTQVYGTAVKLNKGGAGKGN